MFMFRFMFRFRSTIYEIYLLKSYNDKIDSHVRRGSDTYWPINIFNKHVTGQVIKNPGSGSAQVQVHVRVHLQVQLQLQLQPS